MWRFNIIVFLIPLFFIFGQEQDHILFQHNLHVEGMELACEECHSNVNQTDGQSWDIFPEMGVCLRCHDGDTANEGCEYCHTNPDAPLPISKSWQVSRLSFSHATHLAKSKDCDKCHSYIYEDSEIGSPNIWNLTNCQTCHMNMDKKPHSHDLAWKNLHGADMNSSTSNKCALCHTNNSCEECHQLQEFTPEVHPVEYMLSHGFEAKAGVLECSTCHDIVEDCYTCHVANQVMPMNHNFYNWVSTKEGGLHGEFAESEAELCATCHIPSKDSSCIKCHTGD